MRKIAAIILSLTFFTGTVFAQNDLQALAVVKLDKSETITLRTVKARATFVQRQYGVQSLSEEQREMLLENIIAEKLITQAAIKAGLNVTDSQVNDAFLNNFRQQLGQNVTESQLEEIIKQSTGKTTEEYIKENSGMSVNDYKTYLKSQILIQQYVYSKKQNELKQIAATDEEIRSAYEVNKSTFVWNDMLKLFLLMVPKKTSEDNAAKEEANKIRNSFSIDAKKIADLKSSSDNGKKYNTGEILVAKTAQQAQQLGWSIDKLNELFEKKVNFISDVSETPTDFQFYAVLKKYDAKMLGLSDIVQPDTTVTVYDYIKGNLSAQKQSQYFTQAAQELAKELDTSSNVTRKKTGDALKKLLNW